MLFELSQSILGMLIYRSRPSPVNLNPKPHLQNPTLLYVIVVLETYTIV